MKNICFIFILFIFIAKAQNSPDYNGGFKIKFDEEGKKYLRVISWAQGQMNYKLNAPDNTEKMTMQMRRARVLLFSQISPKFMLLTHFGVNNLSSNTLSPTGKGDGSQIFMHDAWIQYNFSKKLSIGSGLHYFNGISRLRNQSTLNLLTLDNNRSSWATLGLSDQFARNIGVFAKGALGKLQYQLSFNEAMTNSLDSENNNQATLHTAVYRGKELLGGDDAGKTFTGYFQYGFLDQESNFLPYKVGTYLGNKKILNIGAGFFTHPKGAVKLDTKEKYKGEDVIIFAIDAFYDTPIGHNGSAITAYAVYQNNDYGENYMYGNTYGTGNMVYGHIGYVLPSDKDKIRFQPYIAYGYHTYNATESDKNEVKIGINGYLSGNNCKLTLEYNNIDFGNKNTNTLNLQAMIYL